MNKLEKLANEMGIRYEDHSCNGTFRNYRYTLIQNKATLNQQNLQKIIVFPVDELTTYQIDEIGKLLKSKKRELGLFKYFYDSYTYKIQIIETFRQMNSTRFEKILTAITEAFKEFEVSTLSKCIFCKKEEPETEVRAYKVTYPAHQECIDKVRVATKEKEAAYGDKPNKYPEGIVGALLGAVLGVIPWVIIEIFTGFYAAILAILIGYSAFFFYKKFGAKVTKATKYIITTVTFIAILFTNVIVVAYLILAWDGLLILDNFIIVYQDSELGPYLIQSLLISIGIGSFGLFSIFKKVKSEEFTKAVD